MNDVLVMYVLYDHPLDYPDHYVIRRWFIGNNPEPVADKNLFFKSDHLGTCRAVLSSMGLVCITRDPTDDPKIIESWL